ncbi:nucleolar MIF4G domain-containing protein 1 homolog [Pectinophora gossypiella]|nr:nucleolar MIF4G domain-containing protein 1 homolog [Pectinophora gossypiella]
MKKPKNAHKPKFVNTRKVLRKQKRQEKKVHRQEHYMKKKTIVDQPGFTPGKFVKRPADDAEPETQVKNKKQKVQPTSLDLLSKERLKEQREVKKLNSAMDQQRKKMLVEANEEEDKMIKKLEKQLGLNKAKNKNKLFADDGLDYLLEICDRATSEQIVAAEKHLADVEDESDFEEDLATVTGKDVKKKDKDGQKTDKLTKKKEKVDKNKKGGLSDDEDDFSDELNGEEIDNMSDEGSETDDGSDLSVLGSGEEASNFDDEESALDEDDAEDSFDEESEVSDDEPEEKLTKSQKASSKQKLKEIETKKETESPKKTSKEKIIKAEDLSKVFSDDEVSHLSDDEDDDLEGFSGDDEEKEKGSKNKQSEEKPDVWEDIYGRKRDKEGNVIKEEKGVYIPPHLRNKDASTDKEMIQLKRQIKSVLNKLAGSNLHWACTSIEALYSNHSRHAVNMGVSSLWQQAVVTSQATPDRMLAEHAALLAALHANVGPEIGAHFLQELTERFDNMLHTMQPVEDKELDNLVSCLAHLYSFKLYHANLLYDILARLTESLTEKHIDCVLVALRSVGGVMRKEDPLALRSFIHDVQGKLAALNETAADGSRIKFLLEVLMAVKNNNLTKIPGYDPGYTEHLRKALRGIIRKGNYITPLNIRLEDLLKADERGKWWVVGSAWEGNRPQAEKPVAKPLPTGDQKLLELARKQRMNTDVRRSIFCVIMAAEDYMSAFEKLEQLSLRGPQQREVAHVVVACCLQEKIYNPYYAVLAHKLIDTDRKYQLSFQFTIWDKIKDLDGLSKQGMTNLAQFIVHLIMEKGLPLSILKIIEFSDLTKRTVKFMRQILLSIIMNEDLQSTLEVFHRIAKPPKLHMFRESLKLFIQHFLVKNAEKKNNVLSEKEMATLKERTVEVDKILTMHENKLRF